MTPEPVNPGTFPTAQTFQCWDGTSLDLAALLVETRPVVQALLDGGIISAGAINAGYSIGFVMTSPIVNGEYLTDTNNWDHPERFVWFAGGWGVSHKRRIAEAACLLRPLLREMARSTLELRMVDPTQFFDAVEPAPTEDMPPWGDIPEGGAVMLTYGDLILRGAVRGLDEAGNHLVAVLLMEIIAKRIIAREEMPLLREGSDDGDGVEPDDSDRG
ncbi:hypothetical protein JNJ66_07395 [Candidatus Saccharibacteria bacterium]|nr:hypothetical protein [Candidatus Saccharibacteria bacterium]